MKITLKTNGKVNAIGVDPTNAILSIETEGVKVDSVCFQVYKSQADLNENNAVYNFSTKLYYAYLDNLENNKEYIFKAVISSGENTYTEYSKFETGISNDKIKANWIENPNYNGQVAEFLKKFQVNGKVKKATLYIVGLGMYRSFINDVETDNYYYKPVLTDFDLREGLNNKHYNENNFCDSPKTVCYDSFDLSSYIVEGENTLKVLLGTGWYCNEDKDITDPSYNYGKPKLFFQLHIQTEQGEFEVLSDKNCLVRNTAIRSQMFEGDTIDFTAKEQGYTNVLITKLKKSKLIQNTTELDKVIETISPLTITEQNGVKELDFGKNHSGYLYLKLKGVRGSKLIIKFYEVKTNGVLDPETSRWPAYKDGIELIGHLDQISRYTLSGDIDIIEPYFHWNSYRYATIECDGEYEILDVKSLFISTAVEQDGGFNCSNEFLNRLNNVFLTTQRSNMHCGVPSDCPQREKLPYTGDGQIVSETVTYSLDTENFYRKWLKDIYAAQGKNGYIPYTAPFIAGGGGLWWSNAVVVVSFVLYNMTGDKTILAQSLQSCINLVKYYDKKHKGDYIIYGSDSSWCLGDWLTPEVTVLDKTFMNTLAWYYTIIKTKEICEIINDNTCLDLLNELQEKVKKAINESFFDQKTYNYATGVQGANILPLLFDIVDKDVKDKVVKNIIDNYEKDAHFDTGIVLTPRLLDLLTLVNRADLAYKILTTKTGPSYYDMIEGETTLPEHWFKHWPGNPNSKVSHSHPMFGSVLGWVYKHVAGLNLSKICDKIVEFSPKLIKEVAKAKAYKKTIYGLASIEYSMDSSFLMSVKVPFGMKGKVILPEYIKITSIDDSMITEFFDSKTKEIVLSGGEHTILGF